MGKFTHPHQMTTILDADAVRWLDKMATRFNQKPEMARFRKDGANQPWTRAGVLRHLVELAMKEHT